MCVFHSPARFKSTDSSPLFESTAVVYRSPIHDSLANRDRCRNRRECQDWKSRMESMEFGREKRPSVMLVPFVERNEASRKRDAVATWNGAVEFREKWNLSSVMETIERSLDTLQSLICIISITSWVYSLDLVNAISRYFENMKYFHRYFYCILSQVITL